MASSENKILIPTDFSEQSLIAIGQSYNLARFSNAKIVLLHVVEDTPSQAVKNSLEGLAKDITTKSGLEVETMISKGNVYKEILKVAEEISPKLIFLGLNSSMGFSKVIGQNAFQLIREANFPVVTIKGKQHKNGCSNIVLPLDLTKTSREKVGKAIEFAKYFNAAIRIISIFTPDEVTFENKLIAYSHQVKKYIKENGVACSNKTVEGHNKPRIVIDYANKIDADLIVIMNQPDLSVKEMFTGTPAQQVVNLSNIPVVTIRPMDRKDTSNAFMPY